MGFEAGRSMTSFEVYTAYDSLTNSMVYTEREQIIQKQASSEGFKWLDVLQKRYGN